MVQAASSIVGFELRFRHSSARKWKRGVELDINRSYLRYPVTLHSTILWHHAWPEGEHSPMMVVKIPHKCARQTDSMELQSAISSIQPLVRLERKARNVYHITANFGVATSFCWDPNSLDCGPQGTTVDRKRARWNVLLLGCFQWMLD